MTWITPGEGAGVRLSAVGDIMVHDPQIGAAWSEKLRSYDFRPQMAPLMPMLASAEITVGNLETTFGGPQRKYTGYPCFSTPDTLAPALREAGFDVVFTANNHCLDRGKGGALRTLDVLAAAGLASTGTFASSDRPPLILERGGLSFAFLAYTYGTNGIKVPKDAPWMVNLLDKKLLSADLARCASADVRVVAFHFGNEYQLIPSSGQRAAVKAALEGGARIVLGTHPHVLQAVEVFSPDVPEDARVVAWSLGNFLSSQRTEPRERSAVLHVDLERQGSGVALTGVSATPVWTRYRRLPGGGRRIQVVPAVEALARWDRGESGDLNKEEARRLRNAERGVARALFGKQSPLSADGVYVLWPLRRESDDRFGEELGAE